jgi:hypothetical protein
MKSKILVSIALLTIGIIPLIIGIEVVNFYRMFGILPYYNGSFFDPGVVFRGHWLHFHEFGFQVVKFLIQMSPISTLIGLIIIYKNKDQKWSRYGLLVLVLLFLLLIIFYQKGIIFWYFD